MINSNSLANLDESKLKKIQDLEKKLGISLLAYDNSPDLANLSEEDLKEIKDLEADTGVTLVGYENKAS